MKNKDYFLLLILIAILLLGCEKGIALGAETLVENINDYEIHVELDIEEMQYIGKQKTTYINNTGINLNELYFHIYPNAFNRLETAPIIFDQEFRDPLSYIPGSIDIRSITTGKENLKYEVEGGDYTILKVILPKSLLIGERIDLYFEYKVKLPNTKDRFGYGARTINFGNWYPIACVYDKDGWNLEPYYKLGDPFYSDVGNYHVSITTPKDVIIASSGNILKEEVKGEKKIYEIEGKLLRDFAWVASKDFKIKEEKIGATIVKLYYLDDLPDMVDFGLGVGTDSIKTFNKVFGIYPYGQYSIVMTEFPSGMEYPSIVFIGNDYFTYLKRSALEQIIVHETAHQWWYGLVGSNQVKEAWLDEGLTTYSETIYITENYGKKMGQDYFKNNVEMGFEYGKYYLGSNQNFNKHLEEFSGWDDYGILVYTKGAMFINQIKDDYGEEILYKIFKEYYKRYKYYNATTEDFIKVCQDITKTNFEDFVANWMR